MANAAESGKPQLLHLVFGGELIRLDGTEFRDPSKIDVVGIFPGFCLRPARLGAAPPRRASTTR